MNLTPSVQIEPQSWMTGNAVSKVMAALSQGENALPAALFVGGCVRNAVIGRDISDIDIATVLTPDSVMEKLEKAGIKALPTGIEHGTVTAVVGMDSFEVTTLRRDVSTDGRRAVVAFTEDWGEDAQRRDFTMNTLLMDQGGNIFDPTGLGFDDLKAGRVRFVGDARQRVKEDYLRILRFFRFYAAYGCGEPDKEALAACREFAGEIKRLSKERITQEFRRILMADDPVPVLELMFENNVMKDILCGDFDAVNRDMTYPTRLLLLAGSKEEGLSQFLILSNEEKRTLSQTLAAFSLLEDLSEKSIKLSLYRYGRSVTCQAALLRGEISLEIENILRGWDIPEFPLSGEDAKNAGIAQGPEIGRVLHDIEEWWIGQDFKPCREDCLKQLP